MRSRGSTFLMTYYEQYPLPETPFSYFLALEVLSWDSNFHSPYSSRHLKPTLAFTSWWTRTGCFCKYISWHSLAFLGMSSFFCTKLWRSSQNITRTVYLGMMIWVFPFFSTHMIQKNFTSFVVTLRVDSTRPEL